MTPESAINDPFVLEFLDLKDVYSESGLEEALIRRLTDVLLELCDGFAVMASRVRSVFRTELACLVSTVELSSWLRRDLDWICR